MFKGLKLMSTLLTIWRIILLASPQILLAPLSVIALKPIFTNPNHDSMSLLYGLAGFSAILANLCYAAGRADIYNKRSQRIFQFAGQIFFRSAITSGIALAFHYGWVNYDEQFLAVFGPWIVSAFPLIMGGLAGACTALCHGGLFFSMWATNNNLQDEDKEEG